MKNQIILYLYSIIILFLFLHCQSVKSQSDDKLYEVKEIPDLTYYDGIDADPEKHKLDLYIPQDCEDCPTMLWIHGGAWVVGSRKQEAELARRFAERGIAMAVMSYRLSPGTWMDPKLKTGIQHPEHIKDCVRALKWVLEQSEEYSVSTKKMFVSGYSAGGQLSALMATDESYLKEVGLDKSSITAALPMAGAYDLVAYYETHLESNGKEMADGHVFGVFVDIKTAKKASPTEYLKNATTPMLVVSETQTYDYTIIFEEKVKSLGRKDIQFFHDRERTHNSLFFALSGKDDCNVRNEMIRYMRKIE